jgi:hypothetical protein
MRRRRGDAPVVSYQALCRELSKAGPGCAGELSVTGARSILRRYSDAWFSANAARRSGDSCARYPRRRRSLMPSRYYAGTFALVDRRLILSTARGRTPLALRLCRPVPYAPDMVRSVTLLNVGPKLFVDVTAEVPGAKYEEGLAPDPARVAGVDLGIIYPYCWSRVGPSEPRTGCIWPRRRPGPGRWPAVPRNGVGRAPDAGTSTGPGRTSSKGVTGDGWPRPLTKRLGPWSTSR